MKQLTNASCRILPSQEKTKRPHIIRTVRSIYRLPKKVNIVETREQRRRRQQQAMADQGQNRNQGNVPQPPAQQPPVAQNAPQVVQVVPPLPVPVQNQPPPAQLANPAPFALFPGAAGIGVLDFTKSESLKLFAKATAPIDPKYNLEEGKLRIFIDQIRQRGKIYGWQQILNVADSTGNIQDITTHYGKLSIDDCLSHALTYVNTPTRRAQDAAMLFQFLHNSLTDSAKLLLMSDADVYTVAGESDGVVFFKLIVGRASIDTNAKVNMLRQKIANLKNTLRDEYKGNVREFNVYVANLRDELVGRGQQVDELVAHLFDAYTQSVPNDEFHRYIEMHRNMYDDGLLLSSEQLMRHAVTKYDTINQRASTSQESEPPVLALQVTNELKKGDTTNEVMQALLAKLGEASKRKGGRKIPAWKKVAPKANESTTKTMNSKTFHWCPKHKMWTVHKPDECTLQDETENATTTTNPTLALSKALMSVMNDEPHD
jgi:hypothetical protein